MEQTCTLFLVNRARFFVLFSCRFLPPSLPPFFFLFYLFFILLSSLLLSRKLSDSEEPPAPPPPTPPPPWSVHKAYHLQPRENGEAGASETGAALCCLVHTPDLAVAQGQGLICLQGPCFLQRLNMLQSYNSLKLLKYYFLKNTPCFLGKSTKVLASKPFLYLILN